MLPRMTASPLWPLFDLRLTSPGLELRPVAEADALALAGLLPADVELDPSVPAPALPEVAWLRATAVLRTVWRSWGSWTPQAWALPFAVRDHGELVGMQILEGTDFPVLRTVDSASWLVPGARGRGIGRRMRAAVLALAFGPLGAEQAVTSAWSDNAASLGVSRALGYLPNGVTRDRRPGADGGAGDMVHLRLSRPDWQARDAGDVRVEGFAPCHPFFALDAPTPR